MASLEQNEIIQPLSINKNKALWYLAALAALALVMLMPLSGLSVAGQRALAIAAFAVIVWVSECISFSLSALTIGALMCFLIGFAPDAATGKVIGLSGAFRMAFSGWIEEMVWFQMGGLAIALAMNATGLDKRIALGIVACFKTSKGVLIGIILATNALAFFMPPVVARMAAMVPIILGILAVFGQKKDSQFAAYLGTTVATMGNTSAFGLLSGGSMNPLVASFVEKATGVTVSWFDWFIWFYPYTIATSITLYFIVNYLFTVEVREVPGGKEAIKRLYTELGPWTAAQKRLLLLATATILAWACNNVLFSLNLTCITLVSVVLLMTPGVGVISWETLQGRLPWGTMLLFATGIALGMMLLNTGAAVWFANAIFGGIGLAGFGALSAIFVFALIGILLHFGFSSSTALCATYIPVAIAYIQSSGRTDLSLVGIPLIILIATGLTILVVNTPNTMIAYNSGTFSSRQFLKVGVINALVSMALIQIFAATYWRWLGIV
ncbi:MAG: anion permease [Deltaproteobacteria bacterium]|jgi:anion transporter|nr:anion permease [Deltaproteobacteria bacterium]